jgi:hypothetical protein
LGFRLRVQGLGSRVESSGCSVEGLFRVQSRGRILGLGYTLVRGFSVKVVEYMVQGIE